MPCARAPAVGLALRGEVLLDLAADAIGVSGATRQSPIEFEGIRARYLPEAVAHTRRSTTRASTHCAQWRCCTAVSTPDSSTKCTGGGTTTCGTGRWRRWPSTWVRPPTASSSPISRCRRIADERGITLAGVAH
jgi:hypothetical protein